MFPLEKGKCKPLSGLCNSYKDYFSLFEDKTPIKPPIESTTEKKSRLDK
jgi:hypothetical protein